MGRYRNVSIFAAVIFVQVVGLAVQVRRATENQSSRLIRVWAVSAITPFEKAIVSVQTGASNIWHNYFYLRGVRQENRQLKEQLEQLQLQQVRLEQDANQAHRLQALLGFKEQFISKTLAAQVIGSSGSGQSRTVYIDKGSHDGIQQDMAVISADGVVGRVITVYRSTAQVLLLNDHYSGAGSIIERSRVLGVTQGKATGELVIDKVMPDEDVQVGDKVLTSGGDLIFPKGLLIGTVARIEKGSEFLEITVKPAAALNRLEEVLVIVKKEERGPSSAAGQLSAADILSGRLPSVPDKPAKPAGALADRGSAANQAGARSPSGAGAVNTRAPQGKLPGAQNSISMPASGARAPSVKPETGSLPASTLDMPPAANQAGARSLTGAGAVNAPRVGAGAQGKLPGAQNSITMPASGTEAPGVKPQTGSFPGSTADKPPVANQMGARSVTGTGAVNTRAPQAGAQGKPSGAQNPIAAPPSSAGAPGARPETGSLPASTPARKAPDSTTSKPAPKTSSQPTPPTGTPQ